MRREGSVFRMPDRDLDLSALDAALQDDAVERSSLVRVVAIGKVVAWDARRIELTALEIRGTGAVLLWRTAGSSEEFEVPPAFALSDDVGTTYHAFVARFSSHDGLSLGEAVVVPAPPATATVIRIRIIFRDIAASDLTVKLL
jgi:hypothetical protein